MRFDCRLIFCQRRWSLFLPQFYFYFVIIRYSARYGFPFSCLSVLLSRERHVYGVANGAPRSKEAFLQIAHDGRANLCNGPGWLCRREHTPRRHPFLPIFPPPRQTETGWERGTWFSYLNIARPVRRHCYYVMVLKSISISLPSSAFVPKHCITRRLSIHFRTSVRETGKARGVQ